MLKSLQRLFGAGDPLIELARSGDTSLFKEAFCSSEVFVVSKAGSITPEAQSMTADELQSAVSEAARKVADGSPFEAFVYGPEGSQILPVFSCQEAAERFVRRYVRAANRVVPFVIASLEGVHVLPFLRGTVRMTLNPLSSTELELSRDLQAELVR
jgi:hypothetical protein